MTDRRAFTLIELLVAIAIGVSVSAVAVTVLNHTRSAAARSRSLVASAQSAEAIFRTVGTHLEAMHPASYFDARIDPGPDATYRTWDDILTVTWMASLVSRLDATGGLAEDYRGDFTWCRLEYRATEQRPYAGEDASASPRPIGRLRFARGSPRRWIYEPGFTGGQSLMEVNAQPRRDHRRDMDDNALTWLPGVNTVAPVTRLATSAWIGDGNNLNANLAPLHAETFCVDGFTIRWLRGDGETVTMTVNSGITITDATGSTIAVGTGTYDNANRQVADGRWNDGRDPVMGGRTAKVSAERPQRLELRFTLVDEYVLGTLGRSSAVTRSDYWACFPLDPIASRHVQ